MSAPDDRGREDKGGGAPWVAAREPYVRIDLARGAQVFLELDPDEERHRWGPAGVVRPKANDTRGRR